MPLLTHNQCNLRKKALSNSYLIAATMYLMKSRTQAYEQLADSFALKHILGNTFVYNDYKNGKQVFTTIRDNLENCDEFLFSVAFITESGLVKIKQQLELLALRGVRGRIITTNYLFFTEPKALKSLIKLSNVEVRMYYSDNVTLKGFHTKGYLFRNKDTYRIIIGSSNLTQTALTENQEWNAEISGSKDAIAIGNVLNEFERMWSLSKSASEVIDEYEKKYDEQREKEVDSKEEDPIPVQLKPNSMQLMFIKRLNDLIESGAKRGLLISATGTGKTYASAFGMKSIGKFKVKKLLFITHREVILKQAKKTFDSVFHKKLRSCIFSGNHKEIEDSDYVFASYNMLIKKEYREKFSRDEFDVVIIDEVHRVGENHYQDIIDYFNPKFLLGMSATPDRTDGYDIYKLFNHNIIYEVRLMTALESEMLTPFNYFGITDLSVDGKIIDDKANFNLLTAEERVRNIVEKIEYYGFSGNRVKGLIFVSGVEEGKILSEMFNKQGYQTVFLDGTSPQEYRDQCISQLEEDDPKKSKLDYIFSVNIFNEGVDIPSINQIVLLRPTESSIVFIQQLGRGLRLCLNKEYVNVLDFIGNYDNNFLIAKALSQRKGDKRDIIKALKDPLPGSSIISVDPIAAERIYQAIDNARINTKKAITSEYIDVKNRLGRIPNLIEFDENANLSVGAFLDDQIFESYYDFLVQKEDDFKVRFNEMQTNIVRYLSKYICNGKRRIESHALSTLLAFGQTDLRLIGDSNRNRSVLSLLDTSFAISSDKLLKNPFSLVQVNKGIAMLSAEFENSLQNKDFKDFIAMLLDYSLNANGLYHNVDDFKLYNSYSRRDVCRLISNEKDESSTIYGYKHFKKQKELPIFVSYHKKLDDGSSTMYEDAFIDENNFVWFSRNNRATISGEVKEIIDAYEKGELTIRLFVEKMNSKYVGNKLDGVGKFYYLGECKIDKYIDTTMKGGQKVVKFLLKLVNSCRTDVYRYIISPFGEESASSPVESTNRLVKN